MASKVSLARRILYVNIYLIRRVVSPLSLIVLCPLIVMLMWHTSSVLEGSFHKLATLFIKNGCVNTCYAIWSPLFFGTPIAWKIIGTFALFQLLLMRIVPGKIFKGPVTPEGNIPIYTANGFSCYLITYFTFYLLSFKFHLFSPTIIYDNLGGILGALSIFSFFFCMFLYIKGIYFPSSSDCGTTGNFIFDFYWGTELYPRILGWDIKMFTNCRFGMMGWGLILLSCGAKQHELYGLSDAMFVSIFLQLVYISKFFIWEPGYLRSLDIMHDRAGFYICWGVLVWIAGVYTSPTLYLVHHPHTLGLPLMLSFLILGTASIVVNYLADRQRQIVREKNGQCTIWGKPPQLTIAHYTTEKGEHKQSLLLSSGWWGLSRHFHYIPEILGAFFWSVPALFSHFFPYFYVVFLTLLLLERAFRDDKRCAKKYGADWETYCKKVPDKIMPYVF
jgi:7-dehydrocholesterol reductase